MLIAPVFAVGVDNGPISLVANSGEIGSASKIASGDRLVRIESSDDDNFLQNVLWSLDGTKILTSAGNDKAHIWDAKSGSLLATLNQHGATAVWSPDWTRVFTASEAVGHVWHAADSIPVVLAGHTARIEYAVWSNDGQEIVTLSRDQSPRVWNAHDGRLIAVLSRSNSGPSPLSGLRERVPVPFTDVAHVWRAQWSPDDKRILTWSDTARTTVWDGQTGAELAEVDGTGADGLLSWSPDGRRILGVTGERSDHYEFGITAAVWEAATGKRLLELRGHARPITDTHWSPDGALIVTASPDGTARVWDANDGTERTLLHHPTSVRNARWSPDGTRLVTTSIETGHLWYTETWALIDAQAPVGYYVDALWSPEGTRILLTDSAHALLRVWAIAR
jgi:WD40 repeat protein